MSLSAAQQKALNHIQQNQRTHVIGIDEVGYGALAGPVTVCAVVAVKGWRHAEVKDSKAFGTSLSAREARRSVADRAVKPGVVASIVLSHDNRTIDRVGVTKARDDLVLQAARHCLAAYPQALVVMDGNVIPWGLPPQSTICLPKADALVPAVSAASILAKVARDDFMQQMHEEHPWYDFNSNVGYGTKHHELAIEEYGLCPIHRRSYRNLREYWLKESRMKRVLARLRGWPPPRNVTLASIPSRRR